MAPASQIFEFIKQGDLQGLKALLSQRPELAAARDDQGVSVVLQALYHRQGDMVEALLAHREDLDLHEAAGVGRSARVAALLDEHPDKLNRLSADGFSALHLGCFFGHPEVVAVLLTRGPDAEIVSRNPMKLRAIHSAAAIGQVAIVRQLLEYGADPNTQQQAGFTPLMSAALHGNLPLIELLLAHGADPSPKAEDGRRAIDFAREGGHGKAADLMEKTGQK